jgi:hypothetical protein
MNDAPTFREIFDEEEVDLLLKAVHKLHKYYVRAERQLIDRDPHRHGCEALEANRHNQRRCREIEAKLAENII